MSDIAIIVGRKISSNINRELALSKHLKEHNFKPHYLIPGPNISKISLNELDIKTFQNVNFTKFNDLSSFENLSKNFNNFLVASWRDYDSLVSIIKKQRSKVTVYSDAGGIDFWDLGCKNLLIKSQANIDLFCNSRRNLLVNLYRKNFLNFQITGSLRYEYVDNLSFQDLKGKNKLLVFFPKSISKLRKAIKSWFPFKNEDWYQDYIHKVEKNYLSLGKKITDLGFKFLVKLHYASEDKFFSDNSDYDKKFWESNGFHIFSGDERNIYSQLDIGLGYETHSAIDVNFHNKPFIYLLPDINMRPQVRGFCLENFFPKNKLNCVGFSEKYKIKKNFQNYLWIPYWYGSVTKLNDIDGCIENILSTDFNKDLCNEVSKYYWGELSSLKASENIINNVIQNVIQN